MAERTATAQWKGSLTCPISNAIRGNVDIELQATLS